MIKKHNEGLTKANPFSDNLPAYYMVPKTELNSSPKSIDLLKSRRRSHALQVMKQRLHECESINEMLNQTEQNQ